MRVFLDTSGYSNFMRRHPGAVQILQQATSVGINAVVLGELLAGFALGKREESNRQELRAFLAAPRVHILPMGMETAERFTLVFQELRRAGTPIPTNDMWIAASAMEHGLRVVTTDSHFLRIATLLTVYLSLRDDSGDKEGYRE